MVILNCIALSSNLSTQKNKPLNYVANNPMVSKDLPKHECSVFDVWRNKWRKRKTYRGKATDTQILWRRCNFNDFIRVGTISVSFFLSACYIKCWCLLPNYIVKEQLLKNDDMWEDMNRSITNQLKENLRELVIDCHTFWYAPTFQDAIVMLLLSLSLSPSLRVYFLSFACL